MDRTTCIEITIRVAHVCEAGCLMDALSQAGIDSGLTADDVAQKAGLESDYVQALAWGKHGGCVPLGDLHKLAKGLGGELTLKYEQADKPRQVRGEPLKIPALERLLAPEKGLTLADLQYAALKNGQSLLVSFDLPEDA